MAKSAMDKQLLGSSRPGYSRGPGVAVTKEDVDAWIAKEKDLGVKSIVCLLADEHLRLYASLEMSLIDCYRQAGFEVVHIPVRDHQKPPLSDDHLARIWTAYESLPKPVLVHCSAGIDRTGSAITHIKHRIEMNP